MADRSDTEPNWLLAGDPGSVQRERYDRAVAAYAGGASDAELAEIMGVPAPAGVADRSDTREANLGWWVISGEDFLRDLRRVAEGENPDLVYAEAYANADIDRPEGERDA
jgi:hypothetical protein